MSFFSSFTSAFASSRLLGSGFGRTDFSRIFVFGPPDFRGFSRRIFSPHFCGKKCPEKSSRKSPRKSSKIYTTKILRHISAEWPGQRLLALFTSLSLLVTNLRIRNHHCTMPVEVDDTTNFMIASGSSRTITSMLHRVACVQCSDTMALGPCGDDLCLHKVFLQRHSLQTQKEG